MTATFRALRNRNYRLYLTGSAVSNVGTWLQRAAQDWLVLHLAGSTALGITTGLQFLPFLLITPFGGLLADRFPKRGLMQCTQAGMGVMAATLAVLDISGVIQIWHVYIIALLFGIASSLDAPVRQSFAVEMVGKEDLTNAVGLNSASFNGARLVGPALAGFLILAFGGTGWVIAINAVSYAAIIGVLGMIRKQDLHAAPLAGRKPGMVREGLRYVRGRPDLVLLLTILFFAGTFGLNFQMTTAIMAKDVFGQDAGGYGVLGSALALGSLAGALVSASRGRQRHRFVVGLGAIFGIAEIVAALMPSYLGFAVALPVLGFTSLMMVTAANATIQLSVAPEMRGRVLALYMVVLNGGKPLGGPVLGWLAESLGGRWSLIGGGVMTLVGVLLATYVFTRQRGLVIWPRLRRRPAVPPAGDASLLPGQRADTDRRPASRG